MTDLNMGLADISRAAEGPEKVDGWSSLRDTNERTADIYVFDINRPLFLPSSLECRTVLIFLR